MPAPHDEFDVRLEINAADDRVIEALVDLLLSLTERKEHSDV
jgi:hypothetical protein